MRNFFAGLGDFFGGMGEDFLVGWEIFWWDGRFLGGMGDFCGGMGEDFLVGWKKGAYWKVEGCQPVRRRSPMSGTPRCASISGIPI